MKYPAYHIDDASNLLSPSMIVFREYLENNLDHMLAIAKSADRLRPHCKTHKMAEVVKIELEKGIRKHKAATFAEAEMLADAGAKDICLAYTLVGPNQSRAVAFRRKYPDVIFSVTADDEGNLRQLSKTMTDDESDLNVLLDLDTGQHRTGLPVGDRAAELYRLIGELPGLNAAGFHVYDGHQHQNSFEERKAAVEEQFRNVLAFRDRLTADGLPVPTMVCGGTGSFPVYAAWDDPAIELSPGTCIFGDSNYGHMFPDLEFPPAAVLLTRVISRPTPDRVTLDLGYKAVASDPPAGKRVSFPELPDAKQVLQNEEHLVLETPQAEKYSVGDELIAVPCHVCPTSALHQSVYVVQDGKVAESWTVTARNRKLTI